MGMDLKSVLVENQLVLRRFNAQFMRFFLNPYMITILFLLGHFVQKKANSFTPVIRAILAASLAAAALSACGSSKWGFPYRADIQQGNWITAEQVARLQRGVLAVVDHEARPSDLRLVGRGMDGLGARQAPARGRRASRAPTHTPRPSACDRSS